MRTVVFKLIGAMVVAASLGLGWLWIDLHHTLETPLRFEPAPLRYVIEPGTSFATVARDLGERGLLDEPRYLAWYARWTGAASSVKAGEYDVPSGISPIELLELFVSGRVVQHTLTLVEGWNIWQVLEAVRSSPHLTHTVENLNPDEVMALIGHPDLHPEGRFFADTYRFPRGTTDIEFLRRAHDTMVERLDEEWSQRAESLPYRSPEDALIMASIVEKETAAPEERARIAGVFVRRLRKGMRLETDPTVIYGLGPAFDGNLRRRDLRHDTPYNTYTRKGLPPTPIAIPGAAALHAALHPSTDDALFFVAKGDGSHYFSATYEEHRKAVRKYQLRRSSRNKSRRDGASP